MSATTVIFHLLEKESRVHVCLLVGTEMIIEIETTKGAAVAEVEAAAEAAAEAAVAAETGTIRVETRTG